MRFSPAVLLALTLTAPCADAAVVRVAFSATSDQFGAAPFQAGAQLAGEFLLDLDAPALTPPACPLGSVCLEGAVQQLRFTIDDNPFTAADVSLQLTPISNGVLLSMTARALDPLGSVSGKPLKLTGAEFEARFPAAAFPAALTELRLQQDFSMLVARLFFADPAVPGVVTTFTLEQGEFRSLVVSEVPLPAAAWLLGFPVAALLGAGSRRSKWLAATA